MILSMQKRKNLNNRHKDSEITEIPDVRIMKSIIWILFLLATMTSMSAYAECDVVATVFKETICQSDITLPGFSNSNRKPPDPARLKKTEKLRLGQNIRAIAAKHLLGKDSYTPTSKEVDGYANFLQSSMVRHDRDNQETIDTIEQLLQTYQYSDRQRKSFEQTLAVYKRSMAQSGKIAEGNTRRDEDMRRRFGEDAVKEMYQRFKTSKRRISERWVASWKMNKALYGKYGGRIIFQQAGIEPIDAYRDYLRDIREIGGLKIHKPEYMDVFDQFERYLDMGHNYLNDNKEKYFGRPYWETVDMDAKQRKHIRQLKATPHK